MSVIALAPFFAAGTVRAATITVSDSCSLADAITAANTDSATGGCPAGSGADIITIGSSIMLDAAPPAIRSEVTIDGGGFTIRYSTGGGRIREPLLTSVAGSTLTLQNIELWGGGRGQFRAAALELGDSATLRNVNFVSSFSHSIHGSNANATYTFESLYFRASFAAYYGPAAIWAQAGTYTMTTMAFHNIRDGGNALIQVDSGAAVTLNGCLYRYQVLPKLYTGGGAFTDNTTGACTGTVGLFDLFTPSTVEVFDDCGIFYGWPVMSATEQVSRSYVLSKDCETITAPIAVPHNLHLTISSPTGQRYSITSPNDNLLFRVAGRLTLRNVELIGRSPGTTGVFISVYTIAAYHAESVVLEDVIIRSADESIPRRGAIELRGVREAVLRRATIEDHRFAESDWRSTALEITDSRNVLVENSTFRNNHGGAGALQVFDCASSVRLLGTNTFTNNSPAGLVERLGEITGCPRCTSSCGSLQAARRFVADGASRENSPKHNPSTALQPTCLSLPPGVRVRGLTASTQCQLVDGAGVGKADIAASFVEAVDIWSWVAPDTQVCFARVSGSFLFLDAADSPRSVFKLPRHSQDGMICTLIDRAGTVVLMPDEPMSAVPLADASGSRWSGSCMVMTLDILNMRATPGGEIVGLAASRAVYTARARTAGWYMVDIQGQSVWLSADYVMPMGDCG